MDIIDYIKSKMKKDNRISKDQIKDYNRRIKRSDFLKFHIELLETERNKRLNLKKLCQEKDDEIKRLTSIIKSQVE